MPAVAEDSPRAAQLLACCLLVTEEVGLEGRALASGLIGPLQHWTPAFAHLEDAGCPHIQRVIPQDAYGLCVLGA